MVKIVLKAILLLCLAATISSAQLRKASEYFPLQVGNQWQFGNSLQVTVVKDSLLRDTIKVHKARLEVLSNQTIPPTFGYYGYNEDSTTLYSYNISLDHLSDYYRFPMLDASGGIDNKWPILQGDVPSALAITDSGSTIFFDQFRHWININFVNPESDSLIISDFYMQLVVGIGPMIWGDDTLKYAKIEGIEYGKRLTGGIASENIEQVPEAFELSVFPNPTSGAVTILFNASRRFSISIRIVNILGQTLKSVEVTSTVDHPFQFIWDGRDDRGIAVPNGVYFVTALAGETRRTLKLAMAR